MRPSRINEGDRRTVSLPATPHAFDPRNMRRSRIAWGVDRGGGRAPRTRPVVSMRRVRINNRRVFPARWRRPHNGAAMPPRLPADPLANTDRLLVDGTNLLHVWRRGPDAEPAAALVGRLRGVIPAQTGIELVLDGVPDRGMHNTRVASGLIVRYSGRRTADQLLEALVDEAGTATGRVSLDNILVVSDDRDLRNSLQRRGVRTAGARWLIGRLQRGRLEAPSTGNRKPPAPTTPSTTTGDDDEQTRWQPGRGSTTKRGNPKRRSRREGQA
jgi:predicted RNA-binding protein with PIN domain